MRGVRIKIPLKAGNHHFNGVSLAADDGTTLNACLVFRGSGPVLIRNLIFFMIFPGAAGVRNPCSPSRSVRHVSSLLYALHE